MVLDLEHGLSPLKKSLDIHELYRTIATTKEIELIFEHSIKLEPNVVELQQDCVITPYVGLETTLWGEFEVVAFHFEEKDT